MVGCQATWISLLPYDVGNKLRVEFQMAPYLATRDAGEIFGEHKGGNVSYSLEVIISSVNKGVFVFLSQYSANLVNIVGRA